MKKQANKCEKSNFTHAESKNGNVSVRIPDDPNVYHSLYRKVMVNDAHIFRHRRRRHRHLHLHLVRNGRPDHLRDHSFLLDLLVHLCRIGH